MFPSEIFARFPPFPRKPEQVFVAMSFSPHFESRRKNVIERGVREAGFEPFLVDVPKISDALMTRICIEIAESRVVLAEISPLHDPGPDPQRPLRNANVMYELGLAHAVRLPAEVLAFREDRAALPFDVAGIRAITYEHHPETDPEGARREVADAIREAVGEIDLTRSLAVKQAADLLDFVCFQLLAQASEEGAVKYPTHFQFGEVVAVLGRMQALTRLQQLGLLRADYAPVPSEILEQEPPEVAKLYEFLTFRLTPFGEAVFHEMGSRLTPRR